MSPAWSSEDREAFGAVKTVVKALWNVSVGLVSFARQGADDWNNAALQRSGTPEGGLAEVIALHTRLSRYANGAPLLRKQMYQRVIARVFPQSDDPPPIVQEAIKLLEKVVGSEGLFTVPRIDLTRKFSTSELWSLAADLKQRLSLFEQREKAEEVERVLEFFLRELLPESLPVCLGEATTTVPLHTFLPNPALTVEGIMGAVFNEPDAQAFTKLRRQFDVNIFQVSGTTPEQAAIDKIEPIPPTKAKMGTEELIRSYFHNTPFADVLLTNIPFAIPLKTRFGHCHIVAGSGHGKTELIKQTILSDLEYVMKGERSVVVIDSQGDMLRSILNLAELSSERLVLIDPNDVDHPPALNLFDFGLDRLSQYNAVDREKLRNGAVTLYNYLFGALLGAELTQKQATIFQFLAMLMMEVPGSTIHTLRTFMRNPETVRPHLQKLDPLKREFFESEYFNEKFDSTREQILNRIWGILAKPTLARMFGSEHNKVDLFSAMNRGSIVLINTAKDLLKEDAEIFGKFFIALIAQAVQERAAMQQTECTDTFIYVDEAQEYFNGGNVILQEMINQSRKQAVGWVLSHQNIDQLDTSLRATVTSSTAIKLVGGLSGSDADKFAKEMRCTPEFLRSMRKQADRTQFACFVRDYTPQPLPLTVSFGEMERRPQMTEMQRESLLQENRRRYASAGQQEPTSSDGRSEEGTDDPDLL